MKQFKNQTLEERFTLMGDLAEQAFRDWSREHEISVVDYGLRRPPFNYFRYLPAEIRHTPDFICEQQGKKPKLNNLRSPDGRFARHFLAETKGCGKDQIVKIKQAELETLKQWQAFSRRPVLVFVFDSYHNRASTSLTLERLTDLSREVPVQHFFDGGPPKPYWAIKTDYLDWEDMPEVEEEKAVA